MLSVIFKKQIDASKRRKRRVWRNAGCKNVKIRELVRSILQGRCVRCTFVRKKKRHKFGNHNEQVEPSKAKEEKGVKQRHEEFTELAGNR